MTNGSLMFVESIAKGTKKIKKALKAFFFRAFFYISRKNSKTSEVNQQSVLNFYIFHHFPKNLDKTITFYSVTLKNAQTEPPKKYYFFNQTNNI